jgi:hypothetical protein
MADQIVYMKLELHGQAIQERQLQQINSSGRTMVSVCATRFNIKLVHFTSVHMFYNKPPLFPDMVFGG